MVELIDQRLVSGGETLLRDPLPERGGQDRWPPEPLAVERHREHTGERTHDGLQKWSSPFVKWTEWIAANDTALRQLSGVIECAIGELERSFPVVAVGVQAGLRWSIAQQQKVPSVGRAPAIGTRTVGEFVVLGKLSPNPLWVG